MITLTPTPAPLRPIQWQRLAWVVSRRFRAVLVATAAILAVAATYLVITGHHLRSVYAAAVACTPSDSEACRFANIRFHETFGQLGLIGIVLMFLPGLLGAFAGAPVLARELETGTFRYTWTQGVGRMRWTFAMLVPGAVCIAAVMGAFGELVTWHSQPLISSGVTPRLETAIFPVTGVAAAGWAMLGFALAAFAGLLWRRVVPALASAFAVWFGLAFLASQARVHYLAPLTTTNVELPNGAMTLAQWWTKGGARISDSDIDHALQTIGANANPGGKITVQAGSGSGDPVQFLIQHGYSQVTSYQPAARYWPFQWIEFGWLTALSMLLLAATLWLVRRRPA